MLVRSSRFALLWRLHLGLRPDRRWPLLLLLLLLLLWWWCPGTWLRPVLLSGSAQAQLRQELLAVFLLLHWQVCPWCHRLCLLTRRDSATHQH
jgi:hypothetical protein